MDGWSVRFLQKKERLRSISQRLPLIQVIGDHLFNFQEALVGEIVRRNKNTRLGACELCRVPLDGCEDLCVLLGVQLLKAFLQLFLAEAVHFVLRQDSILPVASAGQRP